MEHVLQHTKVSTSVKRQAPFFNPAIVQPKLTVGSTNDLFESQADIMADKVMNHSVDSVSLGRSTQVIQRKCSHCEEEEKIQMKPAGATTGGMAAPASIVAAIEGGGQPLDSGTRNFMERGFGHDFSQVRIHNDASAHRSSADINAKAYTYNNHIVFGNNHYQPGSDSGKHLLAHELTHVVQQAAGLSGTVQRQPAVPVYEDYEKLVAAKKWCRDSKESGKLHPGLQCYREIPASHGHPAGKQYCFDIDTHEYKESSPDFVSAVSGQLADGTCNIPMKASDPPQPFTQRGRRSLGHLIGDIATEDADMIGQSFGAFSGLSMGIGLPRDGFGIGSLAAPLILGSMGFLLGRKGLPKLNKLAERHGFLPTISLGLSSELDIGLGIGLEQRRKPLPLVPVNSYLTFGFDSTLSHDDSSFIANVGIRIDPRKQGGLFGFSSIGGGFRVGGKDASPVGSLQAGLGYRLFDFMDVQVVRESIYGDNGDSPIYWVTLKLVAPQNVLKGHGPQPQPIK